MKSKYLMKPNSRVVERVMHDYDISKREAAAALNITVEQFKFKLVKNNFDVRDFIFLMAYATRDCSVADELFRELHGYYKEATAARKEANKNRK